ncbi:MAG: gliding motility-associated C-terminal domain-containing protein [Bacteroidia bacterium]
MSITYRALFFITLISPFCLIGQNDSACTVNNAHYLGVLPVPLACPSIGFSDSVVVSDNTLNYTAEAGRPSLLSCKAGAPPSVYDMDPGSRDTWYIFEASGNEVFIDIRSQGSTGSLINPVIGLYTYQGSCFNLLPMDCSKGNLGKLHLQNSNLIPYQTYYIQVTGATPTDEGSFTLTVKNRNTCLECMQDSYLDVSPKPLNGYYAPGTQVMFTYTVMGYRPYAGNALKVIAPQFGSGWNLSTLSTVPPPSVSGNGTWNYGTFNVNGNFYNCFYFQNATNSGDAGNQSSKWVFRWLITTSTNCSTSGFNLNVSLLNFSDKEVNNLSTVCSLDPDYLFKARVNCCPAPLVSSFLSSSASCNTSCDATYIMQSGGASNYSVSVINQNTGAVVAYGNSLFPGVMDSISSLCAGMYDVIYVNTSTSTCTSQDNIQVSPPAVYQLDFVKPSCVGVCANEVALNITTTSGMQYNWQNVPPPNNISSTYLTSLCHDSTYFIKFFGNGCVFYDSIYIHGIPNDDPFVSYPPALCNQSSITPYVASPGGYFNSTLAIGPNGTIDCTPGSPNNGLTGNYSILYLTNGACPDTGYFAIDLLGLFNSQFSYPSRSLCKAASSVSCNGPTGGYYSYSNIPAGGTNVLSLNSVTGAIDPSLSDTGTYRILYITNPPGTPFTPCDTYYSDTISISNKCDTTFHVYNVISPNGDGKNDFLFINGVDGKENNVFIFNRWGVAVWERKNYNNEQNFWNGTDKDGKQLYEGTYYYLVELKGQGIRKGWVELTR